MIWETVIGLETHVELATKTKLFCACSTAFGGAPNTQCCPVCAGMPGALPVLNERVAELAVKAGLALGCTVMPHCRFDRKNYFYPDLPKAYQVSQLYLPICRDGAFPVVIDAVEKIIRIHELHLEEDAGKLMHDPCAEQTRIDYNRCGVPLIEIVTEPDFRTAAEVVSYLETLKLTLQYLLVSDCKMQEGSLRCDVNLSVRPVGATALGTRTEMKNLNSFKAITRSIAYETQRQIALLEAGGRVLQETRRWDDDKEATFAMRSKENVQDYRYFPDPDLPLLALDADYVAQLRADAPELAQTKQARYRQDWGLPAHDAVLLTSQRALADFFEAGVRLGAPVKALSNWILGPVLRQLSARRLEAKDIPLTPAALARLIALVAEGTLNRGTAVKVFDALFDGGDVDAYIRDHGLEQVSDSALVHAAVDTAFAQNPASVADYRAGKAKALGFLVGQVMHALGGKANPKEVNQVVREKLDTLS